MSSIYQHVLGPDFNRLHPEIQRRFGFSSSDNIASIGRGVMEEVWKGRFYTLPFPPQQRAADSGPPREVHAAQSDRWRPDIARRNSAKLD